MPLPLLAETTSFPLLTALFRELWALTLIVGSLALGLWKFRLDKQVAAKKAVDEKVANERAENNARFKKLEEECHNNSLKHTSAQLERERLVDNYNDKFKHLEHKVSQVDDIKQEVSSIKTRLEVQGTLIASMDSKITEMKSESKNSVCRGDWHP